MTNINNKTKKKRKEEETVFIQEKFVETFMAIVQEIINKDRDIPLIFINHIWINMAIACD